MGQLEQCGQWANLKQHGQWVHLKERGRLVNLGYSESTGQSRGMLSMGQSRIFRDN